MTELKERGGTGLIQLFITDRNYFGCLFFYRTNLAAYSIIGICCLEEAVPQ